MRSNNAGATARNPSLAYPSATERICALPPNISCTTTRPPIGSPAGRTTYAFNSCPSEAFNVTLLPILSPHLPSQYPHFGPRVSTHPEHRILLPLGSPGFQCPDTYGAQIVIQAHLYEAPFANRAGLNHALAVIAACVRPQGY